MLSFFMFCLVMVFFKFEMFGLLVLMFVGVVGMGGLLYVFFVYKICGYLFYFEKVCKFCGGVDVCSELVLMLILNDDFDFEDDEEEVMISGVLSISNENFKY